LLTPPPETPPLDTPPLDTPPLDTPPLDTPPLDTPPLDTPPLDTPPLDAPPLDAPPLDDPPLPVSPASPARDSSSPSVSVDCPPQEKATTNKSTNATPCLTTLLSLAELERAGYKPQTLTHSPRKHSTTAHVMSGQVRQMPSAVQSEADMHSGSGLGGQTHSHPPLTHSLVPHVPPRHI
jgi:hypothetical protein